MKCQNCGNELGQDEVFCGQCGAPNAVPAQQTEMMQQAPSPTPQSGLRGGTYGNNSSFLANQPSHFAPENLPPSRPPKQQPAGFYQDATEAIPYVPPAYLAGAYAQPQPGFPPAGSLQSGYNNPVPAGTQPPPFATGNYPNTNFPPTQMGFPTNQFGQSSGNYGGSNFGATYPAPQPKHTNIALVIGIVCLVFAIIAVGIFGTIFVLNNGKGNPQSQPSPVAVATLAPTPTVMPTPTPVPTDTPIPTPTVIPTPTPDVGFSWCNGTQCTSGGYQVEFPNTWGQSATEDGTGVSFTNTLDPNTYTAFKHPSGTFTSTDDMINNEVTQLQQKYGPVTDNPATAASTLTIGGQDWNYKSFLYQVMVNNQPVQVQVNIYATTSGYIIDLASPMSEFTATYNQYFNSMLNSFRFITPAPGQ